jgi:hypothetical protein
MMKKKVVFFLHSHRGVLHFHRQAFLMFSRIVIMLFDQDLCVVKKSCHVSLGECMSRALFVFFLLSFSLRMFSLYVYVLL